MTKLSRRSLLMGLTAAPFAGPLTRNPSEASQYRYFSSAACDLTGGKRFPLRRWFDTSKSNVRFPPITFERSDGMPWRWSAPSPKPQPGAAP